MSASEVAPRLDEVAELKHRNLFLRLFQGSAVKANEATSLEEAVSTVLSYLCIELGWPVGHAYRSDTNGVLASSGIWYMNQPPLYDRFRALKDSLQLRTGIGLAGRVLASGKPAWSNEFLWDGTSIGGKSPVVPPFATGFAFPIIVSGDIVAILELFTHETLPVDDELLTLMEQVGIQVGLVAERFRARSILEARSAELERSNRELETFASIAAHDLQEPLRKIVEYGSRFEATRGEDLPADEKIYLERTRSAVGRMQTLIDDLLAYSHVTVKANPFVQVDLTDLVYRAITELDDQIARTGGQVAVSSLPTVMADSQQMLQLFQNLVSNALKFHRAGVPPVVRISASMDLTSPPISGLAPSKSEWSISVADNGIGFKNSQVTRLFQMFQRLHGRGAYEGTGIGLAICRKIVERHGGTIGATGIPNEGAVFAFTLPSR